MTFNSSMEPILASQQGCKIVDMHAGLCLHCVWYFCDHSHPQIQAYRERRQPGRLPRLLGHKWHWQIWVRSTPPLQPLACACAVIFGLLLMFCWCCPGAVVYVHECNHCKQCVMSQIRLNTPHTSVVYATLQDCYIRLGILDCHHHSAASCVHSQLPL